MSRIFLDSSVIIVRPVRDNDSAKLACFDGFFAQPEIIKADLDTVVFDHATRIRAWHGLQVADALHLATALEQHADVLWTGDQKLAQVAGGFVRVVLFPGGSVQP